MKMVKFAMMATVMVTSAVAMAGISKRDAQIAKERLARCQYNDSACVGNVIIDALASDRPDSYNPGNGGGSGRQNLVLIYKDNDRCAGDVLSTVVLDGNLQRDLQTCNGQAETGHSAWSMSINGSCTNIGDTSAKGACTQAVNIINSRSSGN